MNKLDLSLYTDKEIFTAMSKLSFHKILTIMNALAELSTKAQLRGAILAKSVSEKDIAQLFQTLIDQEGEIE